MILTAKSCEDFFYSSSFHVPVFAGYNPLTVINPKTVLSTRIVFYDKQNSIN